MGTVASSVIETDPGDRQSGSGIARAVHRWIYVFMAGWYVLITLVGFVPFTFMRIAANRAGTKPPFPPILHIHAVVMSCFLLLLLAQAMLMATGRSRLHQSIGRAAFVLVPVIIAVIIILVPTSFRDAWNFAQTSPPAIKRAILKGLTHDNTLLLEIREIILFPLLMFIALRARRNDVGLHKRMIFIATAIILPPAINRTLWLPRTFWGPLHSDFYILVALSPMLVWDLLSRRTVPKAYRIWIPIYALASIPVYFLWDSHWWLSTVPHLMRVT
jgi:hypothetical protein